MRCDWVLALRPALMLTGVVLSFVMYWPLLRRILRRKSTGDFSKPFQWMVLLVQVNNLALALLERAWYLAGLYVIHIALVSLTLVLVYRYYRSYPMLSDGS